MSDDAGIPDWMVEPEPEPVRLRRTYRPTVRATRPGDYAREDAENERWPTVKDRDTFSDREKEWLARVDQECFGDPVPVARPAVPDWQERVAAWERKQAERARESAVRLADYRQEFYRARERPVVDQATVEEGERQMQEWDRKYAARRHRETGTGWPA